MSFKKMDPSCTIGFYCETKAEFEKFRQQTTEVSSVNKHYYPKQDTAFFIKNILQNHQFVESLAELSEPIWIPSPVVTFAVIRATTFSQFMEQFCSLIKTRLRITANDISWWVPKALLNFQQNNCWCWRILFCYNMSSQQKNLHPVTAFFAISIKFQISQFPITTHWSACILTSDPWMILLLWYKQTLLFVSWPLTMTLSFMTTE